VLEFVTLSSEVVVVDVVASEVVVVDVVVLHGTPRRVGAPHGDHRRSRGRGGVDPILPHRTRRVRVKEVVVVGVEDGGDAGEFEVPAVERCYEGVVTVLFQVLCGLATGKDKGEGMREGL
jgi:hypothetical protein